MANCLRRHQGQRRKQQHDQHGRSAAEHESVRLQPAVRVKLADRADRRQRGQRDSPRHRQDHAADDSTARGQADGERYLGAGSSQPAHHRDVAASPADKPRQALADEDEHGHGCYPAEDGERESLRPDRLLHLIMNDRRAADVEGQAAAQFRSEGLRNLLLHSACQAGQVTLQLGYAVCSAVQPHPDPAELVVGNQLTGSTRRQDGGVDSVRLVRQHGRDSDDRCDPEYPPDRPNPGDPR